MLPLTLYPDMYVNSGGSSSVRNLIVMLPNSFVAHIGLWYCQLLVLLQIVRLESIIMESRNEAN